MKASDDKDRTSGTALGVSAAALHFLVGAGGIAGGLGNLAAGMLTIFKAKGRECLTACMGGLLVAWIVIQCLILWTVNGLHIAFFAVGAVQGCLGFALIIRNDAFPLPMLRRLLRLENSR